MSRVWTVAGREFRGFIDQATAYILAVAFLGLAFFLTFRTLYAMSVADLRSFFDLLPWLLAVFVPAITMRSLAEERSRGTLEWLVAQPLTEVQLVAGKFLGDWLFVLTTLAGTLPMALAVILIADAPLGPVIAQYLGAALLAAQFTGIGLFASSLTRNQITAFILAAILSITFVLAGTGFTLVAIPPALASVISKLAIIPHFNSVARGVVDLRDVLYFVSTAGLFGGLAWFMAVRHRLAPERGGYRRLKVGIVAGTLVVIVVNLLGQHIHGRLDLTADDLYTLSDGTREVLEELDDLVTVKLFVSEALPAEVQTTLRDVRDLLADYRRASDGNLRVVELHPDEDDDARSEASSLGIREVQFNVLREDEFEVRSGWLGLSVQYADERKNVPFVRSTDDLEYRLTSSVAAMTSERRPRMAFLTGFGARSASSMPEVNQTLSERYDVSTVNLEPDSAQPPPELSPDSFDVVALVGPTRPVSAGARETLNAYLDAGGSGLFLLENSQLNPQMPFAQPVRSGLEDLLDSRGVRLTDQMAFDLRSNQTISMGRRSVFNLVSPYPLWPIAVPASDHTVTRDLEALSLAWAGVLDVEDTTRVTPLWSTTEFGGRKPAAGPIDPQTAVTAESVDPDSLARQTLAVAVRGSGTTTAEGDDAGADGDADAEDGGSEGRLVVVADADFLQSQFVQGTPQNLSFAANAVDWLAQDERLIAIRSKDRTPPPLVFDSDFERVGLRWGNLVGVPLLIVLAGLVRAAVRRRRAEELWSELEGGDRGPPAPGTDADDEEVDHE